MKNKKLKIIIGFAVAMIILILKNNSYAAVEIIPSKAGTGKDAIVSTTVSNSYNLCRQMKDAGESLYGSTVEPHLATNKDWGAVSYLSNSVYGTSTAGQNTGIEITIDGVSYYSTTGNASGVMNWGANPNATRYTQTASLIKAYATASEADLADLKDNVGTIVSDNVKELYIVANGGVDTRFVEIVDTNSFSKYTNAGMAMSETSTFYRTDWAVSGTYTTYPIAIRKGLFGFNVGGSSGNGSTSGRADASVTFRPVIWNN